MATISTPRRNGWTADRRRRFIAALAAGADVRRAAAQVGMAREGAYRLRRRDAGFARGWDEALRAARAAQAEAFLAGLPEKLLRTVSASSTRCDPGPAPGQRP